MTKSVLFIAIAAFALSASSAEAAKKKPVAAVRSAPAHTSAPVQNSYPKLENAVWVTPLAIPSFFEIKESDGVRKLSEKNRIFFLSPR